jgi:hypothetical protein
MLSGRVSDIHICFLSYCTNQLFLFTIQPLADFLGPSGHTCSNRVWSLWPKFLASPEDRGRPGALSLNSASEHQHNRPECILNKAKPRQWHFTLQWILFFPSREGQPRELLGDAERLGNTCFPLQFMTPPLSLCF